jgi:SAM-dependent methyltransferase
MQSRSHWERVYATRSPQSVSWYQPHALESLRLIRETGLPKSAAIIDVGGGASALVDDLLHDGFTDLTVLDMSSTALAATRERLGDDARRVQWIARDATAADLPPQRYDLWHDRAVFHFLTHADERAAYVAAVLRAVKPGGHVIVGSFAEDGPTECSGLPVMRYSADSLHAEFGAPFTLLRHEREEHHTPAGKVQHFIWCWCRRGPS